MQLHKYLAFLYLKFFFIILLSLELFFVGIEFVQHGTKLPDSANIQILFAAYDAMYALNFMLPIALVLAQIIVMVILIRSNEVTAIHAIGYSRKEVMKPLFWSSLVITLVYIGLNATSFAYAKERVDGILNNNYFSDSKSDFFVKYENSYVYFGKLYPVLNKAENVRVYETEGDNLRRFIKADESHFTDDQWNLKDATVITKPKNPELGDQGITVQEGQHLNILEGFRPKILDNVYESQGGLSIIDAIDTLKLLLEQNVNTDKIRSILFALVIFPLFSPLLGILIVRYAPISQRYVSLPIWVFTTLFSTVIAWGLFYSLSRLAISGLLSPELSIILPIVVLAGIAFIVFIKNVDGLASF